MLISVIVECKYNDPDSRLFKGLFTLLPGRKRVLKQVQTQFLPSKAALQYQCTAVRRESAASGRKDAACTAAEQADQRSHLAASPGPTITQESPQAKQLLFLEHNHLEQAGGCSSRNYGPDFACQLSLSVIALFGVALCKPGVGQLDRAWIRAGSGAQKKGYGMLPGAGCLWSRGGLGAEKCRRSSSLEQVKKGHQKHPTYNSHGAPWQEFGANQCWLQLERQRGRKSFCFMGMFIFSSFSFPSAENQILNGKMNQDKISCTPSKTQACVRTPDSFKSGWSALNTVQCPVCKVPLCIVLKSLSMFQVLLCLLIYILKK